VLTANHPSPLSALRLVEILLEAGLPPVTFIEPDYIEAPGGINNDDQDFL